MGIKLSDVSFGVLAVCGVLLTVIVIKERYFSYPEPSVASVEDFEQYSKRGVSYGDDRADVVLAEFSDFQCPFCASFSFALDSALAKYKGPLRLLYRHYPIEQIHPFARMAAFASECAEAQGKFVELKRTLFQRQAEIGVTPWRGLAEAAGIPSLDAFDVCMDSEETARRIDEDVIAAKRLGLTATPTILINERRYSGTMTTGAILEALREAEQQARHR